ncbi:Alpha,alpha-trehalose-phosphate synthase 6 [Hibiscus syriacus]|uniref:Alpha,alpha-trehalose-phosphate synthase 6 n=1 Tax=Hibiscus syriacus TaxID=106335 RepID=A0A6A3BY35_HIBSY|nr:Alpha,alpha-trehalose-phosphate synthase 6 [Hibiscus syriacus]
MMSRSYTNLLDLVSGNFPVMGQSREKKRLPRVMTVPGVISELDDDQANSVTWDAPSSAIQDRIIIVANQLPVKAKRRPDHKGWSFSGDDDSLLLQLKDGLPEEIEVLYVGSLKVDVDPIEQDDVSQLLLDKFKCVPAFLPPDILTKFYHGFCKHHLWPLFHYMLPFSANHGGRFDRSLWEAYVAANKIFSQRIRSVLSLADKEWRVAELKQQFEGKTVLLGVDDMDVFKGINLKILAMEQMLKQHPKLQGRAVLVQITNPAMGGGKDLEEIQVEIQESCKRTNETFGQPGYEPIVFIDRPVSLCERFAYYTIAECAVVTAVRDGMNLTPYEYIVCRQGVSESESSSESNGPMKSMLVVSEFIGCSPSLSGAIRVNPWNIESTAEAMNEAISMADCEKQLCHEKHYRYVSSHDVAFWSRSFFQDMERTCKDHFRRRCWGIGLSFGFRVVALDPNFRKLSIDHIVSVYLRSKNRAILLDYDGTVMPQTSHNKTPSAEVISIVSALSNDTKNTVFVVSGRGRESLSKWFSPCTKLGIAAEHGYFMRWSANDEWEACGQNSEFRWKQIAEPVMKLYTESTDGFNIETKESALVWHHRDADPGFGSSQAKEMLGHLESVLANEPVAVKRGQYIVK